MLRFKNWIYINLYSPFRTMKKLKGVFKPLRCYFRYSKKNWYPIVWCSNPAKIHIISSDVMWKDKCDSPRYECCPYIWIHLFGLNFIWYWDLPYGSVEFIEDYWEQALWYLYYYNNISYGGLDKPDIEKAKESWPWYDENAFNTWNNKFLIKQ